MKKIVRLTESDLIRIVTRVINEEKKQINEGEITNFLSDVGGDFARDLLSAVPGAGDLLVAVPSIIKNLYELMDDTEKIHQLIDSNGSVSEIKEYQGYIVTDLVDLIQSILDASPDPGVTEIASFLGGTSFSVAKLAGQDVIVKILAKSSKIIEFIDNFTGNLIIRKLIPTALNPDAIVKDSLKTLDESVTFLNKKKKNKEYLETHFK
jgi:hypothetical protein